MAYDANTDYRALQSKLKKQMETTTDANERAQLQAQWDAADVSRTEKMASNLSKYGKWASDSELDSAAGIMAENQIGTGFERQKKNLGMAYDQAKQNANNDALSRGMARSSYVGDRLSTLDSKRADALSDIDASKASAIQAAKQTILNNYQTNQENKLANEKNEFAKNIGAYYDNYMLEIENVRDNNDPSDDWKIPYLQAARNQKKQQQAQSNMEYGDFSGSGVLGLSPEAQKTAKELFDLKRSQLYASAYGGGGGRSGGRSGGNSGGGYTPPTTGGNLFGNNNTGAAPNPMPTHTQGSVGTVDVRSKVYNMMAGGASSRDIMAAAKKELANGTINQNQYADYQHAVYVAAGAARGRR